MLIRKGHSVHFVMEDGKARVGAPRGTSMLHDPTGSSWGKCSLLFVRVQKGPAVDKGDGEHRDYLGKNHTMHQGSATIPRVPSPAGRRSGRSRRFSTRAPAPKPPGASSTRTASERRCSSSRRATFPPCTREATRCALSTGAVASSMTGESSGRDSVARRARRVGERVVAAPSRQAHERLRRRTLARTTARTAPRGRRRSRRRRDRGLSVWRHHRGPRGLVVPEHYPCRHHAAIAVRG